MGEAKGRGTYEQRRDRAVEAQSTVENVFGEAGFEKLSPRGSASLLMVATILGAYRQAMASENEKMKRILKGEN